MEENKVKLKGKKTKPELISNKNNIKCTRTLKRVVDLQVTIIF